MPRTSRSVATGLATLLLVAMLLTQAVPADAQLSGADTLFLDADVIVDAEETTATSIRHSQLRYGPVDATPDEQPAAAILGTGDVFADNLAAGTLMAVEGGRPLFLNSSDAVVDTDVRAEMDRVLPDGATVFVLGGAAAVPDAVFEDLRTLGYEPVRLAGASRTETAIAIADTNETDTVLIVRSDGEGTAQFADSMGAGALAATMGWDILFSRQEALTATTATALAAGEYATAYVVGGTAALSAATFDAVAQIVPDTRRVEGPTRIETAIAVNRLRPEPLGGAAIVVDANRGDAWADAFSAANLSGSGNHPVVLTTFDTRPRPTIEYLDEVHAGGGFAQAPLDDVFAVCGTSVVPETCQAIANQQQGMTTEFAPFTESDIGVVDRPELVFAKLLSIKSVGLSVLFAFDDELMGSCCPEQFVVHLADGTVVTSDLLVLLEDGDPAPNQVVAAFSEIRSQELRDQVVLAGTSGGNFRIGDDATNPPASFPVGDPALVTPGMTPTPQLIGVEIDPAAASARYTFDEAVEDVDPSFFTLTPEDGTVLQAQACTAEGASAVVCDRFATRFGQPVSAQQVGAAVIGSVGVEAGVGAVTAADDGTPNSPGTVLVGVS